MQDVLERLESVINKGAYGLEELKTMDNGYKMFQFVTKSQNRNDDMSMLYGNAFYDVYGKEMDYNGDGKITVDESYAHWVGEIMPSIQLLEDTRDPLAKDALAAWKEKGLIPALDQTGCFKTEEQVGEIVLNGVPYRLEEDTIHKFLENGLSWILINSLRTRFMAADLSMVISPERKKMMCPSIFIRLIHIRHPWRIASLTE